MIACMRCENMHVYISFPTSSWFLADRYISKYLYL